MSPKAKLLIRLVVLCALFVASGLFGVNWLMEAFLHSRGEVVVPSLTDKTTGEALGTLSRAGLTLTQEGVEYNESVPPGAILRQRPAAGMKVRQGRAVQVVVSKGGQVIFVPDVSGKSLSDAQTAINMSGLALGEVSEVYSILVGRGLVVAQVPKAGEVAPKGSLVDFKISKGNPPDNVKLMPDFRNKSVEEIRAWAREEGYALGIKESTSSVTLSGLVLDQDPLPDQPLTPGMSIRAVTSPMKSSSSAVHLRYEIPRGTDKVQVRIVTRDELGEHEIFKGEENAGDVLDIPLSSAGPTRARIFINDVLVDEKVVGE